MSLSAGEVLEAQTYQVSRADLVAYAAASGDQNPIHQDEQVATEVGLPGVIAHGMFTLALAARAVAHWTGEAEVVQRRVVRKIQKHPVKILDAPDMRDDFYYNVLDWN